MTLIHDYKELLLGTMEGLGTGSKEIEQAVWTFTKCTPIKVHGIILDTTAMTDFTKQIEIVSGFGFQSMRFQIPSCLFEEIDSLLQFKFNILQGLFKSLWPRHEEFLGVNPNLLDFIDGFPGNCLTDLDSSDALQIESNAQWVISTGHPQIKNFTSQA